MILKNVKVYDLEESLVASGYPMAVNAEMREPLAQDWKRGDSLITASRKNGAHGQWLTGVRVAFDVTFSNKAWIEAERYRFFEFVSSQSTMHRITKFDLTEQYNIYVDKRIDDIMIEKVNRYNYLVENKEEMLERCSQTEYDKILKEKYLEILYSNPSGFLVTARITTNYRCLLNMYIQRKDHRLPEWRHFCEELLYLPHFAIFLKAYCKEETQEGEKE